MNGNTEVMPQINSAGNALVAPTVSGDGEVSYPGQVLDSPGWALQSQLQAAGLPIGTPGYTTFNTKLAPNTGFDALVDAAPEALALGLTGAGAFGALGGGAGDWGTLAGQSGVGTYGTEAASGVGDLPYGFGSAGGTDAFSGLNGITAGGSTADSIAGLNAGPGTEFSGLNGITAGGNMADSMAGLNPGPGGAYSAGAVGAGGGAAAPAASALSKVLNGTATASDWAQLAGQALPGLLGAYGLNQQSNKLSDLAGQYWNAGAPSRGRYEASMSPGFDPMSIPGYSGAVQNASDAAMRSLSTQGNPYGNPGGLIDAQKKVISGTALPAIQNYQAENANTGGFGALNGAYNQTATQAIGSGSGVLSSLGDAGASVLNPQQTNPFAQLAGTPGIQPSSTSTGTLADWIKSMAKSNGYSLS